MSKKNEDMKTQTNLDHESTQHPSIDETSRRIIEEKMADRKNKPTYERLYDMNKDKLKKQAQNVLNQNEHIKSKTDLSHANATQGNSSVAKRDRATLDQTLYDDARRRQEENQFKKQELDKVRDQPKEKIFKNKNTDKIVMDKFERELNQVEQDMNSAD